MSLVKSLVTAFLALVLYAAPSLQVEIIDVKRGKVRRKNAVTYDVTFVNNWTGANHPKNYPNNAHWSPPVIATHNRKYKMWREGKRASTGVKDVAETGAVGNLKSQLNERKTSGSVGNYVVGQVQFGDFQVIKGLAVTSNHRHISMISMIAPSPDWFAGFDGVVPVPEGSNRWYDEFTVVLQPYDAGTDGGQDFTAANVPLKRKDGERIFELTVDTTPNGLFVNNGEIRPVAFAKFKRVA